MDSIIKSIIFLVLQIMSDFSSTQKLNTIIKDVVCPNCRYKFKTPKVSIVRPEESPNNSKSTTPKNLKIVKPFGIDLSIIKQKQEKITQQINQLKVTLPSEISAKQKTKSLYSSKKSSMMTSKNQFSSNLKKQNSKSQKQQKQKSRESSIRQKSKSKQQAHLEKSMQKILQNIEKKVKQFSQMSVQCDSLLFVEKNNLFSNIPQQSKSKLQNSRQKIIQILDLNNQYLSEDEKDKTFEMLSMNKYDHEMKINQRDFEAALFQKNNLLEWKNPQTAEFRQLTIQIMGYYKREPLVLNKLPSYLKSLVLKFCSQRE